MITNLTIVVAPLVLKFLWQIICRFRLFDPQGPRKMLSEAAVASFCGWLFTGRPARFYLFLPARDPAMHVPVAPKVRSGDRHENIRRVRRNTFRHAKWDRVAFCSCRLSFPCGLLASIKLLRLSQLHLQSSSGWDVHDHCWCSLLLTSCSWFPSLSPSSAKGRGCAVQLYAV